jgi:hypothetical protein
MIRGGHGGGGGRGRGREGGRYNNTSGRKNSYTGDDAPTKRHPTRKKNQWVRPKADDIPHNVTTISQTEAQNHVQSVVNLASLKQQSDDRTKEEQSTARHAIMTKCGPNQLVLSQNNTGTSNETKNAVEEKIPTSAVSSDSRQKLMVRDGSNKLVAVKPPSSSSCAKQTQDDRSWQLYRTRKRRDRQGLLRRKSAIQPSRHTAKRIKFSVRASDDDGSSSSIDEGSLKDDKNTNKDNDQDEQAEEHSTTIRPIESKNETISEPARKEKLTDFAYRETGRLRVLPKVSHNLHWSKSIASAVETPPTMNSDKPKGPRNMGLVRVAPNEKKTPICPTYLRGWPCQNEFCRKRHDVPRDFATPVCSFFLRHGNCLRGEDCVFRHVKVNPRAMVCPGFTLLGFCEDEACPMQHVRTRTGIQQPGKKQK